MVTRTVIAALALALGHPAAAMENPNNAEIEALRAEQQRIDAEIDSAGSEQECNGLASSFYARKIYEGIVLDRMTLRPDIEELIMPSRSPYEYPDPMLEQIEEFGDILGAVVDASAMGALYLFDCLHRLERRGVIENANQRFREVMMGIAGGG